MYDVTVTRVTPYFGCLRSLFSVVSYSTTRTRRDRQLPGAFPSPDRRAHRHTPDACEPRTDDAAMVRMRSRNPLRGDALWRFSSTTAP